MGGDTEREMPQENVELVGAIIEAAPDWERVRPLLHPDARLDQTRIPDGGVYEGREAFGHFFHRWFGTWDDLKIIPERFIEDGDRVLALSTITGRARAAASPCSSAPPICGPCAPARSFRWSGTRIAPRPWKPWGLSE